MYEQTTSGHKSGWENNFDLIRLFAAAQVMVGHAVAHMKLPISSTVDYLLNAFPGVPIFFVVSGFVIAGSYNRSPNFKTYAKKRCLRIYPALWINILGITFILAFFGNIAQFPNEIHFWLWHFTAFVLGSDFLADKHFGPLFAAGGPLPFYPSGVLWTLPVELSFYLLIPIILRGQILRSLLFWTLASIISFYWINRTGGSIIFIGLYLWIFIIGSASRIYWDNVKYLLENRAAIWITIHIVFTVILVISTGNSPVYVKPGLLNILHTCTLAIATLSSAFTYPKLASKLLREYDISYGLYLWHMPVISIFLALGLINSWVYFLFAATISIVIACMSMILIERPSLALK